MYCIKFKKLKNRLQKIRREKTNTEINPVIIQTGAGHVGFIAKATETVAAPTTCQSCDAVIAVIAVIAAD